MTDATPPTTPPVAARIVALFEVLLCSGFPTQLAIGGTFAALGHGAFSDAGALSMGYVVGLSLIDSVVVIGLVILFLVVHGESPREVVAGDRRIGVEAAAGVPMIFIALAIAMTVVLLSRIAAPWLHTVAENPLQGLLKS